MTQVGPRGWHAGKIEHRFSTSAPSSYDAESHSCKCVISAGSPVARFYGTEILQVTGCDLSRIPVPLLDSHSQGTIGDVLGRISEAWVSARQLFGSIIFAQTPRGRLAEGMVARGELTGISAGYKVLQWSVVDADGDPVDESRAGWDDDLTFTATRWQLLEASLVGVPADAMAAVRSFGGYRDDLDDIRERMACRQRMHDAVQAVMVRAND